MVVQESSQCAMPPPAIFITSRALSSPRVRLPWTSVPAHAITSTTLSSLPKKYRAASMQCGARSFIAPPPVFATSQKCALWGPLCDSRERTQSTRPMPPRSMVSRAFTTAGANTSVSA